MAERREGGREMSIHVDDGRNRSEILSAIKDDARAHTQTPKILDELAPGLKLKAFLAIIDKGNLARLRVSRDLALPFRSRPVHLKAFS